MYAIAIIRYRRPLDEVLPAVDAHRAYLKGLIEQGLLLVSGPLDPRYGGALLLRVPDEAAAATLDRIRDGDPFTAKGLAQYELLPWAPVFGKEELDRVFAPKP
ncbi:YciI family protein [Sorangium sp. So ce302]|uniref:YciI family protein n=1 Tax=unclassified Sorangium TaxID=2621164 RepID=UPI003F635E38